MARLIGTPFIFQPPVVACAFAACPYSQPEPNALVEIAEIGSLMMKSRRWRDGSAMIYLFLCIRTKASDAAFLKSGSLAWSIAR